MAKDLIFVVGGDPAQLKANAGSAREIKSHLARQAWKAFVRSEPKCRRGRKQKPDRRDTIVTEVAISDRSSRSPDSDEVPTASSVVSEGSDELVRLPQIEYHLGGGRCDPFMVYPERDMPCVPPLVDHYLVHMAVDIPELDQPDHKGLLRTRWFPLVLTESASFYAILLLSASNVAALQHHDSAAHDVLQLKAHAIASINDAFSSGDAARTSDALIGAVVKMASYEAMQGDVESYRVHMAGVKRMVDLRGGLTSLGLGGLLRRIIIWVDLNSAFLLNLPRVFPGEYFAQDQDDEPNPERFIAP